MMFLDWNSFLGKLDEEAPGRLGELKDAVFHDLQAHKREDGIHFDKTVISVSGCS